MSLVYADLVEGDEEVSAEFIESLPVSDQVLVYLILLQAGERVKRTDGGFEFDLLGLQKKTMRKLAQFCHQTKLGSKSEKEDKERFDEASRERLGHLESLSHTSMSEAIHNILKHEAPQEKIAIKKIVSGKKSVKEGDESTATSEAGTEDGFETYFRTMLRHG